MQDYPLRDAVAAGIARDRAFSVIAKPHPLRQESVQSLAPQGTSLADIVKGLDTTFLEITVNGDVIPAEYWSRLKPKQGSTVTVRSYPQGKTVRKVVAIVVMAVVIYFTGPAGAAFFQGLGITSAVAIGAIQIGISVLGMLAVNALIKPSPPKNADTGAGGGSGDLDRQNSITGTSNAFAPYGVQPIVIGETRFFPPQCAMPYTEMVGDEQYLRMLLDLGPGALQVSEINIGDDDITTFDDVEYQLGPDPQLYSNDVVELPVNVNLPNDFDISPPKTTATQINEVVVEVAWPEGLYGVTQDGKDVLVTQNFWIQYRLQGSATWLNMARPAVASSLKISHPAVVGSRPNDCFQVASSARKMIRCTMRLMVSPNALPYEVRVLREGTNFGNADSRARSAAFQWVALKSIKYTNPSKLVSTKLAVRIKASDQLNGSISTLNCRVKQNIKMWNGSAWVIAHTNNPAWIYLWLLTACPANPRLMAESRVDIDELKLWAIDCTNAGLSYTNVADQRTTLFELLQDVCAAGKATFHMRDGKYSVVRDVQQVVPVQVFTPRNTWDFSGTRVFVEQLHGLRCGFVNTQQGWQRDERMVYAPGYNIGNATNFETLDIRGCNDPTMAWRLGSYHLAVMANRQMVYSFKTDFENLVCNRGDLILVSHPLANWGHGWGRVSAITLDGNSNASRLDLDEDVALLPFRDNVIRVRKSYDGSSEVSSIYTPNQIYNPTAVFTRSTFGTFRGFDGRLSYADVNEARYEYDEQAVPLGVLIEAGSTNRCLWSELLTDGLWTRTGCNVDFTGGVAPDGFAMAQSLRPTAVLGEHSVKQVIDNSVPGFKTFSVFAKMDGQRYVGLRLADDNGLVAAIFDLQTGALGTTMTTGGLTITRTYIDGWIDGWWRIGITANMADTDIDVRVMPFTSNSFSFYTGNPSTGVLTWGAQLENTDQVTSYIQTFGSAVARGPDNAQVALTDNTAGVVCEFLPKKNVGATGPAFSINNGTANERIAVKHTNSNGNLTMEVVASGVTQANIVNSNNTAATLVRAAINFGPNNYRMSINGGAVQTDTTGSAPAVTRLQFGSENSSAYLMGHIRSLVWSGTGYTDSQLTTYSTPNVPLDDDIISLLSPMDHVTEGDLCVLGVRNEETARMVVTKIIPASDLTATIVCVDEAPAVYSAGTGAAPAFISTITNQPWCPAPPPPLITGTFDFGVGQKAPLGHQNTGGVPTPTIRVALRPAEAPRTQTLTLPAGIVEATGQAGGFCSVGGVSGFNTIAQGSAVGQNVTTGLGACRRTATGTSSGNVGTATGQSAYKLSRTGVATGVGIATGISNGAATIFEATGASTNRKLPSVLLRFDGTNNQTAIVDDDVRLWTLNGSMRLDNGVTDPFGGSLTSMLAEGTGFGGYAWTAFDSSIDISSGDFTWDMAIRPGTTTGFQQWVDYRNTTAGSSVQGFIISQPATNPDKLRVTMGATGSTAFDVNITSTTTLTAGQWYKLSVQRKGSLVSFWIDDVLQGTATWAGVIAIDGGRLQIGANRTNTGWVVGRYGYIRLTHEALYTTGNNPPSAHYSYVGAGVRGRYGNDSIIVEATGATACTNTTTGQSARKLTTAFSVANANVTSGQGQNANAPVTEAQFTEVIRRAPRINLRFDGAANDAIYTNDAPIPVFTALSGTPRLTASNALWPGKTSLAFIRANSESIKCDYDGRIDITSQTADWTLGWWLFPTTVTSFNPWFGFSNGSGNSGFLMNQPTADPTKIRFACGDSNTTTYNVDFTSTDSLTVNTWNYVEVVKSGATFYFFLNGVLQASATPTAFTIDVPTDSTLRFGQNFAGTSFVNGQLGGFFMLPYALHTANFSNPTGPRVYAGVVSIGRSSRVVPATGSSTGNIGTAAGETEPGSGGGSSDPPPSGTLTALDNESGVRFQNELGTNLEGDIT